MTRDLALHAGLQQQGAKRRDAQDARGAVAVELGHEVIDDLVDRSIAGDLREQLVAEGQDNTIVPYNGAQTPSFATDCPPS